MYLTIAFIIFVISQLTCIHNTTLGNGWLFRKITTTSIDNRDMDDTVYFSFIATVFSAIIGISWIVSIPLMLCVYITMRYVVKHAR